jgi:predicted transcriptional regulator
MKDTVITIRLDPALRRRLDRLCKRWGRSRSEVVREALRRQLALLQFEHARRQIVPFAEERGYFTDENVFGDVS